MSDQGGNLVYHKITTPNLLVSPRLVPRATCSSQIKMSEGHTRLYRFRSIRKNQAEFKATCFSRLVCRYIRNIPGLSLHDGSSSKATTIRIIPVPGRVSAGLKGEIDQLIFCKESLAKDARTGGCVLSSELRKSDKVTPLFAITAAYGSRIPCALRDGGFNPHSRFLKLRIMEGPKERPNEPEMSDNKNTKHLDVYNVAYSPRQLVKKDIAESLYQVLSFYESGIIQEI
ncbi:hypothetical protein Tco_1429714, partial [Tanacetum coccineum]